MSLILGYHGCDQATAQELLSGSPFYTSNHKWDWLGSGTYFWESDPLRAIEWAKRYRSEKPCLVGAAIELGSCLDLTTRIGIQAVEAAYRSYKKLQEMQGQPLPRNKDGADATQGDLVLRFLDRAVIQHLHENLSSVGVKYDTVRALFPEGEKLYPNSGFWKKTHLQIAVRKPQQIRGVFRIPPHELIELGISEDIYDPT